MFNRNQLVVCCLLGGCNMLQGNSMVRSTQQLSVVLLCKYVWNTGIPRPSTKTNNMRILSAVWSLIWPVWIKKLKVAAEKWSKTNCQGDGSYLPSMWLTTRSTSIWHVTKLCILSHCYPQVISYSYGKNIEKWRMDEHCPLIDDLPPEERWYLNKQKWWNDGDVPWCSRIRFSMPWPSDAIHAMAGPRHINRAIGTKCTPPGSPKTEEGENGSPNGMHFHNIIISLSKYK